MSKCFCQYHIFTWKCIFSVNDKRGRSQDFNTGYVEHRWNTKGQILSLQGNSWAPLALQSMPRLPFLAFTRSLYYREVFSDGVDLLYTTSLMPSVLNWDISMFRQSPNSRPAHWSHWQALTKGSLNMHFFELGRIWAISGLRLLLHHTLWLLFEFLSYRSFNSFKL